MKIAIIGAGAMGSFFGAMLSGVSEVSLIDINREHVKAVRENGLTIENMDGTRNNYKIFITSHQKELSSPMELAIIFTKSYNTKDAAMTARDILTSDGIALTLQNGIGNLEIIQKILGKNKACAGVTSHGGTFLGPGEVRHAGTGMTYLSEIPGKKSLLDQIVHTFNAAKIETAPVENVNSIIWGKLVINAGINALTAICRVPNGIIGTNDHCLDIMREAVSEAADVAGALGIILPYEDPVSQVKKVCEATANNRASMLQDVLMGRCTEIGAINGAIAEKATQLGISAPVNLFLTRIIKAIETTAEQRV